MTHNFFKQSTRSYIPLALFPSLPTIQCLITCCTQKKKKKKVKAGSIYNVSDVNVYLRSTEGGGAPTERTFCMQVLTTSSKFFTLRLQFLDRHCLMFVVLV